MEIIPGIDCKFWAAGLQSGCSLLLIYYISITVDHIRESPRTRWLPLVPADAGNKYRRKYRQNTDKKGRPKTPFFSQA
jgi:hypothetical protein